METMENRKKHLASPHHPILSCSSTTNGITTTGEQATREQATGEQATGEWAMGEQAVGATDNR